MDQAVIRHLSSWKIGIDTWLVAVRFVIDEIIFRQFVFRSTLILPSYYHFIFAPYSFIKYFSYQKDDRA